MKVNKIMSLRILVLILGGAVFFLFHQWFILPIYAIAWFLFELYIEKEKNKKLLKMAILIGIILMIFDFAFENWGAMYGYWRTINSGFFVLAVPIEIMITCIFGGAAWTLFISKYKNKFFIIINSILWSFGGMIGEYFLTLVGFMNYGNGWLSIPHAFISYFLTFILFYFIYFSLIKRVKINT